MSGSNAHSDPRQFSIPDTLHFSRIELAPRSTNSHDSSRLAMVEQPRVRILFVDDDRATREGYAAYLDSCGYDVTTTASGQDALRRAIEQPPSLVVLDLGLKDMDGWEVARRLKAEPSTAAMPIIAFTGAALPHERISAMRAGCDRVVTKPCAPTALLEQITRCLDT
jgi:CheY-like chemotaxis protein